MELRDRAAPRLILATLVGLLAALAVAAPASAASDLHQPSSQTKPPPLFRLSARQAIAIAARTSKVRAERRRGPGLRPTAYTKGVGSWQVSWFRGGKERVQVLIDDRSRRVLEQWSGYQVAWTMARAYPGAFGRKLSAPYIWIPLCVLFVVPFFDPSRPFRLLHLDLLAVVGFGASHYFFNRGQIGLSVPLAYPVLVYLLMRVLLAGFRPRTRPGRLVPFLPASWLVAGVIFLAVFRIGLNVVDSNVIDVGYAGVIGADRIMDGDKLYGPGFSPDVEHGDTYGPVNYLMYVPFEQALPWSGRWDDVPAAHGAAISFDLLTLIGLMLLGRRLRAGREGRLLGLGLGWAWLACPYTAYTLESNSNDTLVALFVVAALLALTVERQSGGVSALVRGAALGLGAAAKFAPLALAPLFATASSSRRWRMGALFCLAVALVLAATVLPFAADGGLRFLYDRTLGYQAGRPSPFSVWGQEPSLGWLHTVVKAAVVGLALLVALVPARKSLRQVTALSAGVLLLLQLAVTHWFYLYVVWFLPLLLIVAFTAYREPEPRGEGIPAAGTTDRLRTPEPAAAR